MPARRLSKAGDEPRAKGGLWYPGIRPIQAGCLVRPIASATATCDSCRLRSGCRRRPLLRWDRNPGLRAARRVGVVRSGAPAESTSRLVREARTSGVPRAPGRRKQVPGRRTPARRHCLHREQAGPLPDHLHEASARHAGHPGSPAQVVRRRVRGDPYTATAWAHAAFRPHAISRSACGPYRLPSRSPNNVTSANSARSRRSLSS
jgi:hypothetical protein